MRLEDLYANNKEDSNDYKVFSGDTPIQPNTVLPFQNLQQDFRKSPFQGPYETELYEGLDNDEIRAQRQSGLAQLGGGLYNAGLELTLGTLSMGARLFDLQSHAAMITGAQDDASNAVSDILDTFREEIDYDVYRTHFSEGFNPLSTGWWADLTPQIATTLSMMIPAGAAVKGVSMLGGTRALAKGLTKMEGASFIRGAIKQSGSAENLAKGIVGGLTSRGVESLAEASETYKQTYQEALNQTGDEVLAAGIASDAAHSNYKYNWLMAASDILQFTQIMNGMSKRGELLKTMASEAGEEGYQFITSKESEYSALRDAKLRDESTFSSRLTDYLTDSEFYNSLAGGAIGGGLFHVIGEYLDKDKTKNPEEKLKEQVKSIEAQNAAAVVGDKKTFFDIADAQFTRSILDGLRNNTLSSIKENYELNKTTPKDQLDLTGQSEDTYLTRTNERLEQIKYAEEDWNRLKKLGLEDADVSLAVATLIEKRNKDSRLLALEKDIENKMTGAFMHAQLPPELQALKSFQINLLAAKSDPKLSFYQDYFQKEYDKLEADLKEQGINTKLPALPSDPHLIESRKDSLLLRTELSEMEGKVNNIVKAVTDRDAARLKKEQQKQIVEKFKEKISTIPNDKLEALLNAEGASEELKEVIQTELTKREKEAKAQEELEKQQELQKELKVRELRKKLEKGEITLTDLSLEDQALLNDPSIFTQENDIEAKKADIERRRQEVRAAIQKAGQGEGGQFTVTLVDGTKENAVRISLVGNELGIGNKGESVDLSVIKKVENPDGTVLYDTELAALENNPIEVLGEVIDETKKPNESFSLDGEESFSNIKDESKYNNDTTIYTDGPSGDWMNNPKEINEGTKVYFEYSRNPNPKYHKDTVEEFELQVRRESDGKLIGVVGQHKMMDLRASVFETFKKNMPIRFVGEIASKSRGKIEYIQKGVPSFTLRDITGGEYYIGFVTALNNIEVPNSNIGNLSTTSGVGKVSFIIEGANGIPVPLTITHRALTEDEQNFVIDKLLEANTDNYKDISNIINEVTYVGRQSSDQYSNITLDLNEEGIIVGNGFIPYDNVEDSIDILRSLLSNPNKKRNIRKDLANNYNVPYNDPVTGQHESYNDFLANTRVITADYRPLGVFSRPFIHVSEKFTAEDIKTPNTSVPPVKAASRKFKSPKLYKKNDFDVIGDDSEGVEWLKKNYPNVPINVVNDVAKILNDGGPAAFGAFFNAAIYLATNRPVGTSYHEAFHMIFDMLLTDKQRSQIYKEAEVRYNETDKGKLEEHLAEEFKKVMITKSFKSNSKIFDFFKRLYNIIMDFLLPNKLSIDVLMYRAATRSFNPLRFKGRAYTQFQSSIAKRLPVPGMLASTEREALDILMYEFFNYADTWVDNILNSMTEEERSKTTYDYASVIRSLGEYRLKERKKADPKFKAKSSEIYNLGLQEMLDVIYDNIEEMSFEYPALKEILKHWTISKELENLGYTGLKEKLVRELPKYGIPLKVNERKVREDQNNDESFEQQDKSKEGWQVKFNSKDIQDTKLSAKIKRIIRMLPSIKEWKGDIDSSVFNESSFGLPKFTNFQEIWKVIKDVTYDAETLPEMIEALRRAGKITQFKELFYLADIIQNSPYEVRSQYFTSFSNSKNRFISILTVPKMDRSYDEYETYEQELEQTQLDTIIIDSNTRNIVSFYKKIWRNLFKNIAENKLGKGYREDFIKAENEAWDNLVKAPKKTINEVTNLVVNYFSTLGITITPDAIKYYFSENPTKREAFLFDKNVSLKTIHENIAQGADPFQVSGGIFTILANSMRDTNPSVSTHNIKRGAESIHVFGNKKFYDKWFIKLKKAGPENLGVLVNNSVWLTKLKENWSEFSKGFDHAVLSEHRYKEVGKRSKLYKDFTPGESYLNRLNLFLNRANGKSRDIAWYLGLIPADNDVIKLVSFKKFSFDEAVSGLVKHFGFEVKKIKEANAFVDKVIKAKETWEADKTDENYLAYKTLENELVLNYHYAPKTDKLSKSGNAFRLQNFQSEELNNIVKRVLTNKATKEDGSKIVNEIKNIINQEARIMVNSMLQYKTILKNEDNTYSIPALSDISSTEIGTVIKQFIANQLLANMEMSNLFMGGSDFYKADSKDGFASIDPVKRTTQLSAPGEDQIPEGRKGGSYKMIVLKTEKITSRHDGKTVIDYTDASGFSHINRYLDIIRGTGRFDKRFTKFKDDIKNGRNTQPGDVELQPVKGHYFGHLFSNILGKFIPTQVKYALKPLIPSETKVNDRYRMLSDYMAKYEIDEAVYDSAIKVGLREMVTWEQIEKDLKGEKVDAPYIYNMSKENWKWQQNVPEHHLDHHILLGTQLRKLILTGIDINNNEKLYTIGSEQYTGKEIFDLYQELTSMNVKTDLQNLVERTSDEQSLQKLFKEELETGNYTQNYELAIKLYNGKLIIPPTMSKALEYVFNSMFNKIIKQEIRGGQFVQVAALGNEDLKFVKNENGVITEAEVLLPWWARKFFPIKADGTIDTSRVSEALLHAVGYRIPTEAKYSMLQFKVVGFLPPESGSCIICPPEVVEQMGSDFDVDKLFVMFYDFKEELIPDENGTFIMDGPDGNVVKAKKVLVKDEYSDIASSTKEQRNNKILDIIRSVLNNAEHYDELTSKNNFDTLKSVADIVYGKIENKPFTYLSTQEEARLNNLEGAELIGIAANTNIHHAVTQFTDMTTGKSISSRVLFNNEDDNGKAYFHPHDNTFNSLSNKYGVDGKPIWKQLSQFLAAFVDNAKDPVAAKLNINFLTFPVASLIVRTSNTLETALFFINQPVIRELAKRWKAEGANESALYRVALNMQKAMPEGPEIEIFSTSGLKAALKDDINTVYQAAVLKKFLKIYNISKPVEVSIAAMRADSKGVSPDTSSNRSFMESVYKTMESKRANTSEIFGEDSPYKMIPAFTSVVQESVEQSAKRFPWGKSVFDEIHYLISNNNLNRPFISEEQIRDIDLSFLQYLYQSYGNTSVTPERFLRIYNNTGPFINSLIALSKTDEDLENREKLRIFAENEFIKNLDVSGNKIKFADSVEFQVEEKNQIIDAFRTLYKSDMSIKYMGKEYTIKSILDTLILYSTLVNGFKKSLGSFSEYIPIDITDELGFRDYYARFLFDELVIDSTDFVVKFLRNQHNLERVAVVKPNYISKEVQGTIIINGVAALNDLTLSKSSEQLSISYPLVVMHKNLLYTLVNDSGEYGIYNTVGRLGMIEQFEEYTNESAIKENNLKDNEKPLDIIITPPNNTDNSLLLENKTVKELGPISEVTSLQEYTNHSGGAKGYEGDITPDANTIFVFGSNPEGRHGAGAAKIAKEQFGAIYGQGEGLQGNAYALPTKDLRVKENNGLKSISFEQIVKNIQKLYEVARQNPNKQFKIGYRNTIDISLNGYTGLEMIDMFKAAGPIPSNVIFSKEWIDTGKFNSTAAEPKFKLGQYVEYKGNVYIIVKDLGENLLQIYNPLLEGAKAKLRVSINNIGFLDSFAEIVPNRGIDYIVTPKDTIISLITNKIQKWDQDNGLRKEILERRNTQVRNSKEFSEWYVNNGNRIQKDFNKDLEYYIKCILNKR